jgi:hypothetical protein
VLWVVWIGLGVAFVATAVGVYRSVRGGLAVYRAVRELQGGVVVGLEALADATERLAARPDPTGRLEPALASFERSRARLEVLVGAVEEVRVSVRRVTVFFPRK